jgi:hypothetical protein
MNLDQGTLEATFTGVGGQQLGFSADGRTLAAIGQQAYEPVRFFCRTP